MPSQDNPTTIITLVRHAETNGVNATATPLNAKGQKRAQELARVLNESGIEVVFVTDQARTRLTAQPLVTQKGLLVEQIDRGDNPDERKANLEILFTKITSTYQGKKILIVGHSETLPAIIAHFASVSIGSIESHDNLFILAIPQNGQTRMLRLKYGNT